LNLGVITEHVVSYAMVGNFLVIHMQIWGIKHCTWGHLWELRFKVQTSVGLCSVFRESSILILKQAFEELAWFFNRTFFKFK
jgi:hypothetical protein